MPDPESSPAPGVGAGEHPYPSAAGPATPGIARRLRGKIASSGPLPFPEFMAAALYDPDEGYYARRTSQVGRGGDFFTSVSVGPLFGALLARRFLGWWHGAGRPSRWRVIEAGAHDGKLAADVLAALDALDPAATAALEYVIPEPLPRLRDAQRQTLVRGESRVRHVNHPVDLGQPLPGIAFGNEVLDALPCHLVERRGGDWHERVVAVDGDGRFSWESSPSLAPALQAAVDALGEGFPEGYRTEVRTNFRDFLAPLAAALDDGLMLWIDYGFARPDYYHPDRTTGTLRTFAAHRAGEDPLAAPGEADITAHVDFTAVAEVSAAMGWPPACFDNQGAWLTRIGRDWLAAQEGAPDARAIRQFQTLTHPGQLGARFHVLECATGTAAPEPTAARRLALGACRPRADR